MTPYIQTSLVRFDATSSTNFRTLIVEQPSSQTGENTIEQDSLIAKGPENVIYIGVIVLIVGIIVIVGMISQNVDRAIIFAGILSLLIILFLLFLFFLI